MTDSMNSVTLPFDWAKECLDLVDKDQRLAVAAGLILRAESSRQKNIPGDAWAVVANAAEQHEVSFNTMLLRAVEAEKVASNSAI